MDADLRIRRKAQLSERNRLRVEATALRRRKWDCAQGHARPADDDDPEIVIDGRALEADIVAGMERLGAALAELGLAAQPSSRSALTVLRM